MRWVLLRGWAREARHWEGFPDVMRSYFPEAEVLAPDLPGAGLRSAERSPATLDGIVEAVRAALPACGEPVHLLGLSLGAMACARWACRDPDGVAALVLVNTSLRPFCPPWRRLRPASFLSIARALAASDPAARERIVLALTSAKAEEHPGVVERWAAYAGERPMRRTDALRQLLAATSWVAPRVAPPVPTLVLSGALDRLVDPRCSAAIAEAWNVPRVVHPAAGHDLPLDDAAWVAAQACRWLRRS